MYIYILYILYILYIFYIYIYYLPTYPPVKKAFQWHVLMLQAHVRGHENTQAEPANSANG